MSVDLKKHSSIASGEKPTRAALAAGILSINDIVPVANATEANQVATALVANGANLANTPLTVRRADAPGLHTIEITKDGTNWVPSSGVLHFATNTARDSWTTTNSALLTAGDIAIVVDVENVWNGTSWDSQAWTPLTPAAGWVAATGALQYRRRLHTVQLAPVELIRTGTTATITAGANNTIGTLPAGFRPAATAALAAGSVGVAGNLGASRWFVDTGGNIFFQSLVATGTMGTGGGVTNHVQAGFGTFEV